MKSTGPESEKQKWSAVLVADAMSSEDSDPESDALVVKPLPWRSSRLNEMFMEMDRATVMSKSSTALRQRRQRVIGDIQSKRTMPDYLPRWAIKH